MLGLNVELKDKKEIKVGEVLYDGDHPIMFTTNIADIEKYQILDLLSGTIRFSTDSLTKINNFVFENNFKPVDAKLSFTFYKD